MNVETFKKKIEDGSLEGLVFIEPQDETSKYVVHQYIDKYCRDKELTVKMETEIPTGGFSPLFGTVDKYLTLVYAKTVDTVPDDIDMNRNCWVIADKFNKKLDIEVTRIPKLLDWQVKDFIESTHPELKKSEVEELIKYYGNDIWSISNELDKITEVTPYNYVKSQLYNGVSEYQTWDFTESIVMNNESRLREVYSEIENIDVSDFYVYTILLRKFKQIIDIQLSNGRATPEKLGVSKGQFYYLKKSANKFSNEELIRIYKNLLEIEVMVKNKGNLPPDMMVDYMLLKIFRKEK